MSALIVDINGTPHKKRKDEQPDFDVLAECHNNRYLVLASNEGDLFNPQDVSLNLNRRDKERGGMFWKLRTCSQQCYEEYTIFLRSRNRTPYILAQRRFRNDF